MGILLRKPSRNCAFPGTGRRLDQDAAVLANELLVIQIIRVEMANRGRKLLRVWASRANGDLVLCSIRVV